MEQNNKIKEMTPEELTDFINRQEEYTIVSITIAEHEEGGSNARSEGI